jgi:hypothetical protein
MSNGKPAIDDRTFTQGDDATTKDAQIEKIANSDPNDFLNAPATREQLEAEDADEEEEKGVAVEVEEGEVAPAPKRTDPGINITAELGARILQVVDDNSRDALIELTNMRDRTDAIMHSIRDADQKLKDQITTHVRKIEFVIGAKKLITKALDELEREFAGNTVVSTSTK